MTRLATEAETSRRPRSNAGMVFALLVACAAFQLNASMLSPALVTMARELDVSEASAALAQTVFFSATAVFGIFLPRWSDIIGRRRVMLLMLTAMTVGSVIAALAPNLPILLAARALQGASGPVVAVSLLILRTEVRDPRRYGYLMGLVAAVNGGIAGVDAIAGGLITTYFGFRPIFWIIAVLGVAAILITQVWTPESRPSARSRMDWWGVLILAGAILSLQLALNELQKLSGTNWWLVGGLAVAGVVLAFVFVQVESVVEVPLAAIALLKQRAVWALLLTTALTLAGVLAVVNAVALSISQNTESGFGLAADTTSLLLLTPYALLGWIVGPFAGRLAPVWGYRTILRLGLGGSVLGILAMAFLGTHSLAFLIGSTLFLGVTYAGMANIVLNGLGVVLSPPENPGFLPGLNSAAFGFGAGISFTVIPALQMIGSTADGVPTTSGYALAMFAGAGITLLALAVSFLLPKPRGVELNTTSLPTH
ncbi:MULTISPECIES: MFS transporter [unclassified Rathayibacter]|uniref:MFS transporter n=1 Tax=unclassified Rathayibacter TaxID=2609250 RepID=UPI000CE771C8|nr:MULTISPECIES: MFS transporter [unclassified Rathayibacter]PPG04766.1 MFS transporter [Rathayibacter sp. AY2B1]PPG68463.1 MFS transporter [Rathayibacter sp. AY1F4]